jgi:leucyl aminopeptidase
VIFTVHRTPAVSVSTMRLHELEGDVLAIPVFEDDDMSDLSGLSEACRGEIDQARARGEFRGKLFELFLTPITSGGWKVGRVALVGAGKRKDCTPAVLRRTAIVAGLQARQRRLKRLVIVSREGTGASPETEAQAVTEGAVLSNFDGASHKTVDRDAAWLDSIELRLASTSPEVEHALERGRILGECTNLARELSNEPGNRLTPRTFAERASTLARTAGLGVEILDEARIAELHMGLLLGVASGSHEPPRVVVLRHEPKGVTEGPVLGLVGKGITFDTGGISIKPALDMDRMKDDMAGGAAVLCGMAALSRLNAPVRCMGVIPTTENMPGGRAIKPGDVLRSAAGKTVEVLNTDAEGRLILGDGLWYARQLGVTHLIDIATLTGACIVALGHTTSGLFGTPEHWLHEVWSATERAGDRAWKMPLFDDYKDQLKSEIADFTNTGGRLAGAITGALFIKEFVDDLPWVHMDIAGTAWAEEAKPYQPKGATGVGVRTLAELGLAVARWDRRHTYNSTAAAR